MKYLLRLIVFNLMVGSAYAQSKLPACSSSGWFSLGFYANCFGSNTYADGAKYVGEWSDNKRNGEGTYTFADGDKFVGEWKDDNRNGQGTLYASNGSIISQGIWASDKFVRSAPVQQATAPNQENERLRAEAAEAKKKQAATELPPCPPSGYFHNCFGNYTFASGDKYVGEFKDDKYNGQGTATLASGQKYVGEFKDGTYNGQGTATLANGNKYVGEFKDGKYAGQGTETSSRGHKYIGEFKDGTSNGQGTLTFPDGTKYVGEFKDGIWNGKGTFTDDKGNKHIGEWKDGKKNGQGTYFHLANNQFKGNKYVGEWKENMRNGHGTEYAPDGSIISQGIWASDKFVRSAPVQQATEPNRENERLRAEAAEAKRKQAAAEEKMRDAQQLASQNRENERLRAEVSEAKRKQAEAEEKTLVAQQQTTLTPPVTIQAAIPTGKRVALVVGNKNYKVRPLQNTLNDADDISRSLRTSGFEVIDLRDATLPQMRTAVRQFGDKLLTYDVGLVYYSGHGVEVKGRNYFIPVNADIQREDEIADQGLDVSLILEKMSTAGKGVNILIVDACRDDPFGRSFRSTSRGLAQMDAPRGTIIAYSTSPGKVASDGDTRERNSPYTKHLLRAMQSPNKPIEQVFKEVRRAVQDETKNQQTPWENTSLSGDFFFKVQR